MTVGELSSVNGLKLAPSVERASTMSYALSGFVALACCQIRSIAPLGSVAICGKPVATAPAGGALVSGSGLEKDPLVPPVVDRLK